MPIWNKAFFAESGYTVHLAPVSPSQGRSRPYQPISKSSQVQNLTGNIWAEMRNPLAFQAISSTVFASISVGSGGNAVLVISS